MNGIRFLFLVFLGLGFACAQPEKTPEAPVGAAPEVRLSPIARDATDAIKQVLAQGAQKAITDGASFRPGFPAGIQQVEKAVSNMGLQTTVEKFVVSLGEASQRTLNQSRPVWIRVIENMKIENPESYLAGDLPTATAYFKKSQNKAIHDQLRPITEQAIKKTELLANWGQVAQAYNSLPIVTKIDIDLTEFVMEKTIEYVTIQMGDEETLIRRDPAYRSTELMKKVFKR